ncbi:MAG: DUF721 domain-containing protein [Bryobacterales bacterium]|nr:DUF721 domain-containing protein [Bryobacterales bacterium]
MERAAKLLTRMKLAGCVTPEEVVMASWPAAVGKKIAAHTKAVSIVRGRLIVEVEDYVWQTQLRTLRRQILQNLERLTEAELIADLEFRIAIPRRSPQRALTPLRAADDADAIRDPVLSRIYRLKRQGVGS